MRGMGAAFLAHAANYWNTADQADKYMLANTVTWALTAAVLPLNART